MRFSPIFNDLRPKMDALGNPERIAIARPRVARNELPWVTRQNNHNPERVESFPQISFVKFQFIPPQKFTILILK